MKNENKNTLSAFEELENIKSRYYKRLNLNSKLSLSKNNISLKYCDYHVNFFIVFDDRIDYLENEIKNLKEQLLNYKGNKIVTIKENEELNKILCELNEIRNEAKNEFDFYTEYLTTLAAYHKNNNKKNLNFDENFYNKISEEIVNSRFRYYIKKEKRLLILNDLINNIKTLF